jgi:hypothetical protein
METIAKPVIPAALGEAATTIDDKVDVDAEADPTFLDVLNED